MRGAPARCIFRNAGLITLIAVSFFQYFSGVASSLGDDDVAVLSASPAVLVEETLNATLSSSSSSYWSSSAALDLAASLQGLFGVSLYSYMCHHSLPSIVSPVVDPNHRMARVYLLGVYVVVFFFYVALGALRALVVVVLLVVVW